MRYAAELDVMLAALDAAGAEVMRRYDTLEAVEKAPANVTTDADRASQEIILKAVLAAFPQDRLCGEEDTATLAAHHAGPTAGAVAGGRLWIVDPIDGTRGFVMKTGEFSLMLACVCDGVPVAGGVYEPATRRLTYAVQGGGCWRRDAGGEPQRCRVRPVERLADAVLTMSRSQGVRGRDELLQAFGAAGCVQTYSAGIKLAQVARGEADLYLGDYLNLRDWDVCAGDILVTEAGGTICSVDGAPIRYDGSGKSLRGRGLLAVAAALREPALAVLQAGRVRFAEV